MNLVITPADGNLMFGSNSEVDLGAVLVRIAHQPGATLVPVSDGQFTLAYDDDGSILSVLAYMPEGGGVPAGNASLFTISADNISVSELQASDAIGHLLSASSSIAAPLPTQFAVLQNYPNPFNANTQIKFELPTESDISIGIYNVAGQAVKTFNGRYAAGRHQVNWDATAISSGIYFARVSAGDNTQIVKMTLLK
jgi:hypothetical protein